MPPLKNAKHEDTEDKPYTRIGVIDTAYGEPMLIRWVDDADFKDWKPGNAPTQK